VAHVRPVYLDRLPPCNHACPAGENIQGWLYPCESGDYEAAWRLLTADNPFAAIMGRVCYHPCEGACNRGKLDESVGINSVERFLGDEAIKRGWKFEPPAFESGKHVLIVGAGPSGLSAAYHLRRLGHRVKVVDAGPMAGGMMRFGIPKYRLPRDVLDAEVAHSRHGRRARAEPQGVEHSRSDAGSPFDAAFLAVGAHIAKRAYIPAGEAAHMLDAVSAAQHGGRGQADAGPARVVYGGGNTASTSRALRSGWAPPMRSSSTAARANACRRTTSRSRRRCRRAC
jgi:NADPH-dependent glutamate synthase beta subunit-like oxidoreductase